jgi:hypothetical protein
VSRWLIRFLFAALLAFGGEILVWVNPPGRTLIDWLLLVPGYVALAAILLDLTVRYRVRDLFGAMVLSGIFSLLGALVLNPAFAFVELPRTFITRVMGAESLLSLEMIGLFLALTGGENSRIRRLLLGGCGVVGLAWGLWVRWWPADEGYGAVDLPTMLIYGVVGVMLIGAVLIFTARKTEALTLDDMRLSRASWGGLFLLLVGLFVVRIIQGGVNVGGVILAAILLTICWAILWFRERAKGETLLDGRVPVRLPSTGTIIAALVIFFAVAIFAYNLPLIQVGQANQLIFIGVGFTAYGLAWLPTVSLVLGGRAYMRQISRGRV